MSLLEIACFNAESALIAESSGAHRIELCKEQALGGTTPLISTFQSVKKAVKIPVNVMIRPRGMDFVYDDDEFLQMKKDIESFTGVDGFVFGILRDGKVDEERCRVLVEKSEGRPCTFHRAFDEIPESQMMAELEVLVRCGFKSVLTSGGRKNALEGRKVLGELVEAAKGRIDIIAGGGVRSSNLEMLRKETSAGWFHSSAIVDPGGEVASRDEVTRLTEIVNR
jgi:copper homeostasis protein